MKSLVIKAIAALLVVQILNHQGFAQAQFSTKVPSTIRIDDGFEDNRLGWRTIESDSIVCRIQEGAFFTSAKSLNFIDAKPVGVSLKSTDNYWSASLTTNYREGNGFFGLVFGAQNQSNFNLFLINGNANYLIVKVRAGVSTVLKKGVSEKINKGAGATNVLEVQTDVRLYNSEVRYLVNGSGVTNLTAAEQKLEDARLKAEGKEDEIDFGDMMNESNFLEPAGQNIGVYTTKGCFVTYDNFQVSTKPNKGTLTMLNNNWEISSYSRKFLNPKIAAEEDAEDKANLAANKRRNDSTRAAVQRSFSQLSDAQLRPLKSFTTPVQPELEAVLWYKEVLHNAGQGYRFMSERELVKKEGDTETYILRHYLPGVTRTARLRLLPKDVTKLDVMLGQEMTEEEAKRTMAQALVNLCAAEGADGCKYYDLDSNNPQLHKLVLLKPAGMFQPYPIAAQVIPVAGTDGKWLVLVSIQHEEISKK